MKAVILAAGVGSRLGNILPKCLIEFPNKKTILARQIELLREIGIKEIIVVVGFKKEIIMEKYPHVVYIYNPFYHMTNTSKSLMVALESINDDDVIWINGDVFLEAEVLRRIYSKKGNIITVNKSQCGAEEVKYKTNRYDQITEISKNVLEAEGEALGVNKISKKGFTVFLESLRECDDNDYFEKAVEISIGKGIDFFPIDISDCKCIEIDFKKDLKTTKKIFYPK